MLPVQIRCYHANAFISPYVFFILSKGDNAGKPAFQPWANCFMAVCSNQQTLEFYFWLCYGLFKNGKFKIYHHGTAIQFINIADVQTLISSATPLLLQHWQQYQNIIQSLAKLEKQKATFIHQIIATEKLQQTLIQQYFNK